MNPQRSTTADRPVNAFVLTTTLVLAVCAVADAHAFALGNATAVAPSIAAIALRIGRSPFVSGKCESFDMKMAAGHARRAQVAADRIRHSRRPAEKDVTLSCVGNELAYMLGGQQTRSLAAVVADDIVDGEAKARRDLVQLVFEDEIRIAPAAVEDDDVAAHVLDEGPDRRDADAAGDQQHLVPPAASRLREDTERPLGKDARPGAQPAQPPGVVSERLDGDAQRRAVGRRGEREGVRRPDSASIEEPPEEELPGLGPKRVELASGDTHRHDPGRLVDDLDDLQPVARKLCEREHDSKSDEDRERRDV